VPLTSRALSLPLTSRLDIYRQIRLRVVREFNLPDEIADLMENSSAACYCVDDTMNNKDEIQQDLVQPMDEENSTPPPSPALPSDPIQQNIMCYSRNLTFPRGGAGLISSGSSSGGGVFSGFR
jgi:BTB/POZ domain-containing protein 7